MSTTSDQTVLVTGGAGFIGCAMSSALADQFGRVVALDSLHPQIHPSAERPGALDPRVELVVGDVSEDGVIADLLTDVRPDVVVHLAAETGTGQSLEEGSRHTMVNVVGASRLHDALARSGRLPARIVLSSSRAVYGEGEWRRADGTVFSPGQRTAEVLARSEWDVPDAEPLAMDGRSTAPDPASVYAATKLAQEHLLKTWARAYGVEPFILRLQNVYGPGQSLINPYTGILSLFCRMAMAGSSIPLYEDGEVRRDFVLIDDVADALVRAATSPQAAPAHALDIGSGEFQTIRTAAELIARAYGAPAPHVTGKYRQGDVRHAWADITAAQDHLGWQPRFSLSQGIDALVAWIATQPGVEPVHV